MWYMPYLRVRRAVVAYGYVIVGISLAAVALRFWPGAVRVPSEAVEVHVGVTNFITAAAALVGGFATVLGLNLAAENDGHLEVAWTKPVSRERYALGVFAVDLAAMAACIIFTALLMAVVVDIYAGHQAITLGPADAVPRMLAFCGFPLCIYAWIAASSASLKRNRGVVAGLSWPFMIVLVLLTLLPVPAIHALSSALNLVNPLAIFWFSKHAGAGTVTFASGASTTWLYLWGWAVAALLLAAALFQWRRLQL